MKSSHFDVITSGHADLGSRRLELEVEQSRRALALLKTLIGPVHMLEMLAPHLEAGNSFWTRALAQSDGELVPAFAEFRVKNLSSVQFTNWFKQALSVEEKLISANPEHYRIFWSVEPSRDPAGLGTISVTEALGGVLTKFDIVWGGAELAYIPLDPTFSRHILGSLRLEDGREIGRLMHQFRDDGDCMIARFCILLPKGVPDQVVAHHREHLVVEWANWFESAIAELAS